MKNKHIFKSVLAVLCIISLSPAYAAIETPDTITTGANDNIPVVLGSEVQGGYMVVADNSKRDAISPSRRAVGMLCYVLPPISKTYRLVGGIDNANWVEVPASVTQWGTSGADIYYSAGNVGIGTTSPGTNALYVFSGPGKDAVRGYTQDTGTSFAGVTGIGKGLGVRGSGEQYGGWFESGKGFGIYSTGLDVNASGSIGRYAQNSWYQGLRLNNAAALYWTKGPNYTFSLGQSGDILYIGRANDEAGGAGTQSYDMVVNAKGYVGIGATSPWAPLDVKNAIYQNTEAAATGFSGSPYGPFGLYGKSTDPNGTGVIAIGGTSSRRALYASGTVEVTNGDLIANRSIQINNTYADYPMTTGTGLRMGSYGTSYRWIQSYDGLPLVLNPLGNNVGIRTTTTDGMLDIQGSDATRRLKIGFYDVETSKYDSPHHIVSYRDMVLDSHGGFYFRDNPTAGNPNNQNTLVTMGSAGTSTLQVNGSFSAPYRAVTYSIDGGLFLLGPNDFTLFCYPDNGNITVHLPKASSCPGRIYVVKRYRGPSTGTLYNVTIDCQYSGSDFIMSNNSSDYYSVGYINLGANKSAMLQSNGQSMWNQIN